MKNWTAICSVLVVLLSVGTTVGGPIVTNPLGGPWYEFRFSGVGVPASDGSGTVPSGGGNSIYADAPPWTFVGPGMLTVTDAFQVGDRFEVFDSLVSVGLTSVPSGTPGMLDVTDPAETSLDSAFSSGVFDFGGGDHSITIVPVLSPYGGGAGYFKLDASVVPEPASLAIWCVFGGLGMIAGRARRRASERS